MKVGKIYRNFTNRVKIPITCINKKMLLIKRLWYNVWNEFNYLVKEKDNTDHTKEEKLVSMSSLRTEHMLMIRQISSKKLNSFTQKPYVSRKLYNKRQKDRICF